MPSEDADNSSSIEALAAFEMTDIDSSVTAGAPFSIALTAKAGDGSTLTSFTGTVTFSSSDSAAILPASYTFTASDAGIHTFSDVEFRTAGSAALSATSGSITLTSNTAVVVPGAASLLTFTTQPVGAGAGVVFATQPIVTVTDAYNNFVATGSTVTLGAFSDSLCQNVAGGVLSNHTQTTDASGVATYTNLSYGSGANIYIKGVSGSASACSNGVSVGVAPASLSYTGSPYTFGTGVAISNKSPTVSGSVASYSISPDLVAHTGLAFSTATGVISGTPSSVHAATTYTITATNPFGFTDTTVSIETGTPPSALSYTGSPISFPTGTLITDKSPSVTGSVTSYAISPNLNAQTGLDFDTSTGVISGTPSIVHAATTYTITATNSFGSTTTGISIATGVAPSALSFTGSPYVFGTGVAITDKTPSVTGTATSYTISPDLNAQTGLDFNTTSGVISGTATAVHAATTYTITAINAFGSTPTTVSIRTGVPPSALSYTGAPFGFATGSAIASKSPTVTGSVTTYAISPDLNAQTGLDFDTSTGVISGTPSATHAATSYTITATNIFGSTTANVSIATGPAPSALSYTGSPFGYPLSVAISALTPSVTGSVTSYSISPNLTSQTGLDFDTSSGVISGTPSISHAATTYTITATNAYGSTTTTVSIETGGAAPSALSYTGSPYSFTVGVAIADKTPSVTGTVASYSISPGLTAQTGLTFSTGTGVISGTPTTARAQTQYTITATNAFGSTTYDIDVTVIGSPSNVSFTTQPGGAVAAGTAFTTQPVVTVTDSVGNPVAGASVVLSAFSNSPACSVSFSGNFGGDTATVSQSTDASGVATFAGVSFLKAGTLYLKAAVSGGGSACSTGSVTVSAGTASTVVYNTQPAGSVTTGTAFSTQPIAYVTDANGNDVSGLTVTLSAFTVAGCASGAGAGSVSSATAVTNASGVATFSGANYSAVETIYLKATVTGGSNPTVCSSTSLTISSSATVTAASLSADHTCAIYTGGIKCFGGNANNQLGSTGASNPQVTPISASGLASSVTAIAAGSTHTCALVAGVMKCWGSMANTISGNWSGATTPTTVSGYSLDGGTLVSFSSGNSLSCSADSNGVAKCWGPANYNGQMGTGNNNGQGTVIVVSGLTSGVTAISAAKNNHSCAVVSGKVMCFGSGWNGEMGTGTGSPPSNPTVPVYVSGINSGATDVVVGYEHSCALVNGGVQCWGNGNYVGTGNTSNLYRPVIASGLSSGVTAITVGRYHSCALINDGTVRCWGANGSGQLGTGDTTTQTRPVQVTALGAVATTIQAGHYHTCALVAGAMKCWGESGSKQLGVNSTTDNPTPATVTGF